MRNVTLILDDGSRFCGKSFGYEKPVAGEVVFNTAMSGYPESLTDPSYAGQLMTLTYPLAGNYGVPPFTFAPDGLPVFMESERIHAEALIVSDYSGNYSHWNAVESLGNWLKREQVPGITGIDTRELTKVLREHGVMMGKIVFDDDPDNVPQAAYAGVNYVDKVSCREVIRYNTGEGRKKVLLVDCGVKANIIRCLLKRDVEVIRVPWDYDFNGLEFDGLFISNGPGDAEREAAYLRHLHGQSATLQSRRSRNIQIEIRTPQPQPARTHGGYGALFHHFAEPRLCGGQQHAGRRLGTALRQYERRLQRRHPP